MNRQCILITLGSLSWLKSAKIVYYSGTLNMFQKFAMNALEKMTSVLKAESAAGESYDLLYDGAKSLVNGLGSILKVAAHGARVYDSQSQGNFLFKANFVNANERLSLKSRRVTFRSRTSPLLYLLARRTKRDANDAQLQVKNRSELRVQT